jgi:hypothetical protein
LLRDQVGGEQESCGAENAIRPENALNRITRTRCCRFLAGNFNPTSSEKPVRMVGIIVGLKDYNSREKHMGTEGGCVHRDSS